MNNRHMFMLLWVCFILGFNLVVPLFSRHGLADELGGGDGGFGLSSTLSHCLMMNLYGIQI